MALSISGWRDEKAWSMRTTAASRDAEIRPFEDLLDYHLRGRWARDTRITTGQVWASSDSMRTQAQARR